MYLKELSIRFLPDTLKFLLDTLQEAGLELKIFRGTYFKAIVQGHLRPLHSEECLKYGAKATSLATNLCGLSVILSPHGKHSGLAGTECAS